MNTRQMFNKWLDDTIDEWLELKQGEVSLREHLGMNKEEYGLFLVDADNIFKIMMEQE
ncbi:MAG: hypothetical protein [Caudoviricetes sp.]|nr:MAG: hypothetical protein [Caudoviricetes sp.]